MDFSKKRKADENGGAYLATSDLNNEDNAAAAPPSPGMLSPEDAGRILEPLTKERILPIIRAAILRHPDVLESVRAVADADPAQRKLFVRGLGWETTTDKLREIFSAFGELDEANTIVITDKNTGKSKGYGFVTYKHIDGAIFALKEPNKKIDGRITVTQLAAAGNSGNSHMVDVATRKIYVGNIPFEISLEKLLAHFSIYGEIEEGPLGFDKQTGKARGFAFFLYKTEEGAKACLFDPMKVIDGHQVVCKLASDNKKQNPNMSMPNAGPMGMPSSNYGMGGGYMGYGSGPNMPSQSNYMHQNVGYNSGGPGYAGAYGGGSSYGAGNSAVAPAEFGGGLNNNGGYRGPPSNIGMQSSGGYPDSRNYGLSSAYQLQQNQPGPGTGARPPQAYQGMPPYY